MASSQAWCHSDHDVPSPHRARTPPANSVAITSPTQTILGNATPTVADGGPDPQYLQLGMQFEVTQPMYATGVRFYKSTLNTGTHVGKLWSVYGGNDFELSAVTFTNETGNGWQSANFPAPVELVPGQSYIIAYSTTAGHYAADAHFNWSPYDTLSPLRTSNTINATHGGFSGSPDAAPTNSYQDSNYWVDVIATTSLAITSPFNLTTSSPTTPDANDTDYVEVGMRFGVNAPTEIVGMRGWYSGGWWEVPEFHLWKSDGTLLKTATYNDLNGTSRWYQMFFDSPVILTPGQEYVVSSFAKHGHYGYTTNIFNSATTVGQITIPQNAGVRRYTGTATFSPSANFPTTQSTTNYWIEPITSTSVGTQFAAVVEPSLTFTVAGMNTGQTCGDVTTTSASTSSMATLSSLSSTSSRPIIGQTLTVATNASNGYETTIRQHAAFAGMSTAHTFAPISGTNATPIAWPAAGTEAYGYTTSTASLTGDTTRFRTAKWAALSTTPEEVLSHSGPSSEGGESTCVAFGASMSLSTPADNYRTTLTYAAIPSF